MNKYLSSGSIRVIPTTRRPDVDPQARSTTEASIVSIINKLICTDGFVITPDTESGKVNLADPFEFNIHGYYFRVAHASDIVDLASDIETTIYANIITETTQLDKDKQYDRYPYVELYGTDDDDQYKGIEFSTKKVTVAKKDSSTKTVYSLLILQKENGNWVVPSSSRVKFEQSAVKDLDSLLIDGGDIDAI